MKIGIVQMPMDWTVASNSYSVQRLMKKYKNNDVDLLVFPILTLTGVHEETLLQGQDGRLEEAMLQLKECCVKNQISIALGVPFTHQKVSKHGEKKHEKHELNYLLIDKEGEVKVNWSQLKNYGSRDLEFETGSLERECAELDSHKISSLLWCEAREEKMYLESLGGAKPDMILWPTAVGDVPEERKDEGYAYTKGIKAISLALEAWLFESNWGASVYDIKGLGGNRVVSPEGEIVFRCPEDELGVGIYDTESRQGSWHEWE